MDRTQLRNKTKDLQYSLIRMFMDMAIEHLSIIDKLYTKLHDDYDEHCYDKLVEDTIGKFNGRIKGLDTDMDVITTLNEVYDNMEATNEKL